MIGRRHLKVIVLALLCLMVLFADALSADQTAPQTLENRQLRATIDPQAGTLTVLDKQSRQQWFSAHSRKAGAEPRFRDLRQVPGATAVSFEADFAATDKRPNTLRVTLRLPEQGSDLVVEADMARRDVEIRPFAFLDPLVTDSADAVLVVADYGNGHLYPANTAKPIRSHFAMSRMDMPWIGVCDLPRGTGYMILVETSDDGFVACPVQKAAGRDFAAPLVHWSPSKGQFAYPRRLIYHFASRGGYVALAKRYREYAAQQGLTVPLTEKVKKNPTLQRLFGAPDVWGDATLRFAQEAKAAGVDKMLIHGRSAPSDMKAINDLGYLTSEYDNYTDVLPIAAGKTVDSSHDRIPESVVLKADHQRMPAWLTFDKKQQYMKRCPGLWVETARQVVPPLLKTQPYLGRFVDVTTAEDLYECFDPHHPLTRGQKRQCGVELLAFMRSQGLVVGGEHGIWWGVPQQDYIEGMMSGGFASWPAGHLLHPKTKTDTFNDPWGGKYGKWENYEQWGIGHESRVPLWELVFHDCVVSTWYWGDASDFLLQAAPEITPKKDAFNILYGTIPLLWANREGAWHTAREVFLRTYRNTCKLHEALAVAELLSHEWLTPDRAVQRTRFSDGTEVVVNFGAQPYEATVGGRREWLPQNGFLVKGPKIEQSLVLDGQQPVTTIRTADYFFSDAQGARLTMRGVTPQRLMLHVGGTATGRLNGDRRQPIMLPLSQFAPGWKLPSTRLYQVNAKGERLRLLESSPQAGGFQIGPFPEETTIEALCGSQTAFPDLHVDAAGLSVTPAHPKPGQPLAATVTIRNSGGAPAERVEVACYADVLQPERKLASQMVTLAPAASQTLSFAIDTTTIDGPREILVVIDPAGKIKELCTANNGATRTVDMAADYTRWQHRRKLVVEAGALARQDEPVVVSADLAQADPASVRVIECDAAGQLTSAVPTQMNPCNPGSPELCFVLTGTTPAGTSRHFTVLWDDRSPEGKPGLKLAACSRLWHPELSTVVAETYQVRLDDGMLVDLAARHGAQTDAPFIAKLMLSSQATGWTDEPGKVERCEVITAGPVRVVIAVRKALNAGIVYDKTYIFYSRRFDVLTSVNKPAGTLSRAYYTQSGQFVDNAGNRALVDGRGDDEGVLGKNRKPIWYAVYAERWAHSCIALSTFGGVTYWDAGGNWGGIGLDTGSREGVHMCYVIHPHARDASYAENDYRQLVTRPLVRLEP